MPPPPAGWAGSLEAVASMAGRLSTLIRSVPSPDAAALGVWSAGELAAHVTHVFEVDRDLLREIPSPLADLDDLSELTQSRVRDDEVRSLPALAGRLESAAEAFLATAASMDGTEPRLWLGGVKGPASVLACHILNESTIHGFDLASAAGRPWKIEREHARLAFEGFICTMYPALGKPSFAVDQRRAAGVRACYDVRVRGGRRYFLVFENGGLTIEPPSDRTVDCHLWADPRALMLLSWHRTGLVKPVVTGQVIPWGRRPWMALRLPGLLQLP